jgi:hypothetical protein
MAFTTDSVYCNHCSRPRYNDERKPYRTIKYLPLAHQLALLLNDKKTRQDLTYRSNYQASDQHDDILSGTHYQSLKNDLFANEFDIAIGLYVDGFSAASKPSMSLTMVNVVIFNYHPSIR